MTSIIYDKLFTNKEGDSIYQAADFPGGVHEWMKFIERNITPDTPGRYGAPPGIYTITASFIIDTPGINLFF